MVQSVEKLYSTFAKKWRVISALGAVHGILDWDQQVMMPKKGGMQRAEEMAALEEVRHTLVVANDLWSILEELREAAREGLLTEIQAANVRLAVRDTLRARKIPTDLAADIARQQSIAQQVWEEARTRSDFSVFAPALEKILALKRSYAGLLADDSHDLYTALLQDYEPDFTTKDVERLFAKLAKDLVPLVAHVLSQPEPDRLLLSYDYSAENLDRISREIVTAMGLELGSDARLDIAMHPFCAGTLDDIRITTRYEGDGLESIYSAIHEAGHALYEQGLPREELFMPMCAAVSLGIHESQSRLWEVGIGKSLAFVQYLFPKLKKEFPALLQSASAEDLYRVLNAAKATPIRVNADPLTYNLHIFLRFALEKALVAGEISVEDLPGEWNKRFQEYFGFTPKTDALGVLQDVHWSCGLMGYFSTYTLGNGVKAQLLEAAQAFFPNLDADVRSGNFAPLREWLRSRIHKHGSLLDTKELIKQATGKPLGPDALIRFFKKRLGDVYQTEL